MFLRLISMKYISETKWQFQHAFYNTVLVELIPSYEFLGYTKSVGYKSILTLQKPNLITCKILERHLKYTNQ